MKQYPIFIQGSSRQCGSMCIAMISKYFGTNIDLDKFEIKLTSWEKGVSLFALKKFAQLNGFKCDAYKVDFNTLKNVDLPVIAHWYNKHFIVIYRFFTNNVLVGDPAIGFVEYKKNEFIKGWVKDGEKTGIILTIAK